MEDSFKRIHTIHDLLNFIEKSYDNPKALNSYYNNAWQSLSTKDFLKEVRYIALALHQLGIKKEEIVGIMAQPCSRWTIVDLAIMAIGGVSVPLFANISDDNFHFIIAQTNLKTIFISGEDTWMRYEGNKKLFKTAISLDTTTQKQAGISYNEMLDLGHNLDKEQPKLFEELTNRPRPDDLATIIYTSGSTGFPKGAEHTQRGLTCLLHDNMFRWDSEHDVYMSVLPLAHIFGRLLNLIIIAWGISTYYFNDLKNLTTACKEVKPTIMAVVPRLLEKVYSKMTAKIQSGSWIKRNIGQWAMNLANEDAHSIKYRIFSPLAELLVYSKLKDALGGRLRVIISGGAALDPQLYKFYLGIGLPLFEGWGLSEGTPITVNRIGKVKVGTIGLPLDGVEVKTSEDGELLARGPLIMRGYYRNPEATDQALDAQGWLHTGDKGTIDKEGFVTIIGRIKELFKTSTGEIVTPVPIENALNKHPYIETAVVIADKKKFASCLLVPDIEVLKTIKTKKKLEHLSETDFLNSSYVRDEIQRAIDEENQHLNYWEKIKAYRFISQPLSVERGELTPSMKIVRFMIEKNYKDLIDSIYQEDKECYKEDKESEEVLK